VQTVYTLLLVLFVSLAVQASEPQAVLALKTEPTGAMVYINEELRSSSTPAVFRLAPGTYQIRAEKQGLQQQATLTLTRDTTVVKTLHLTLHVGGLLVDTLANGEACPFCPAMVILPVGAFTMGKADGFSDEEPVHTVAMNNPFAMSQYEVTFVEYDAFTEATGAKPLSDAGWGRVNRPAIHVSWSQAAAYAKWLSGQTGHFYRLPTEAEWEYAARGGTQTDYWWGDAIGQGQANCRKCGSQWDNQGTAPVGQFGANPFGLYDMVGNVREWTCSVYQSPYAGKESVCVEEQPDGALYVIRGGAWKSQPPVSRVSYRYTKPSDYQRNYLGFRVVRTLSESEHD